MSLAGFGYRLLWVAGASLLLFPRALPAEPALVPVVDLHVDLPYRSLYETGSFASGSGQVVASRLLSAGVRGVVLPLYVPQDAEPHGRSRYQLERSYAHVFRSILATPPYALPGCGIARAGADRRSVATWLAFEGAAPIGADKAEIRRWAMRGVRSFGLVHAVPNRFAGSSGRGADPHQGLSDDGRKFVEGVFEVGGVVDVSHASRAATSDAIEMGKRHGKPVIATHSNAFSLAPHPRNLTDREIRGIAQTGGVIGVNFHNSFLRRSPRARATLMDVVEQMQYLSKVGGMDVVAIGSDFEGGILPATELEDASKFQNLARALRRVGWTQKQIEGALFKNALRVLCAP